MTEMTQDISVIICTYTEDRWDDLFAAVKSVQQQTSPPLEIIVVIDHNQRLLECLQAHMPDVVVLENRGMPGASEARNSGVAVAKGKLIAFLDDDAEALPNWLEQLCAGYGDSNILGVGGEAEPVWLEGRPRWFPEEFHWIVGGTHRGIPEVTAHVRNLWACNMSVRRDVFDSIGGFRSGFGNVTSGTSARVSLLQSSAGDEETDFCIRALQRWPQGVWLYKPDARVRHKVPASRACWSYFVARCYAEGLGKAQLVKLVGARDGLASERRYTFQTLPRGVALALADAVLRHDLAGLARAGAIVAGLAITTIGYLVGTISTLLLSRNTIDSEVKPIGRATRQKIGG
jgi:glycosyltransferase involved in cell wall biosynthesis